MRAIFFSVYARICARARPTQFASMALLGLSSSIPKPLLYSPSFVRYTGNYVVRISSDFIRYLSFHQQARTRSSAFCVSPTISQSVYFIILIYMIQIGFLPRYKTKEFRRPHTLNRHFIVNHTARQWHVSVSFIFSIYTRTYMCCVCMCMCMYLLHDSTHWHY